jgi:hypothetical protein
MLVCNLNNNRSRSMNWHTQDCWCWWLIHTDNDKDCWPKWGLHEGKIPFLPIGCNSTSTSPQGPPKDLCMENLGRKLNTIFIDHWSSLSGLELRDNDKKFRANDKLTRVQVNY